MTIKVKLAAIAKDEAAYIPQWIHHHLSFGFDEIEIWLNNTTDNSESLLANIKSIQPEGVVKFRNADILLQKCLAENLQFQQLAYSEIYSEALQDGKISHILFLDLDEFWVPQDFTSSIGDFINAAPEFDAISFQWMIDTPDFAKHVFSPPFSYLNLLQKNRHVKTLAKITDRMDELSVHNHVINGGTYRLASGDMFPGSNSETINKSLVPVSHQKIHGGRAEKAFILHQINRTPIEYLSSLLRGRGHKNDNNVFKVNRIGYLLDNHSAEASAYKVDVKRLIAYNNSLARFSSPISEHIAVARNFIIERFYAAVQKVREQPELLKSYRDQLRGVRINDLISDRLECAQIFSSVDRAHRIGCRIDIEGWAFDALSCEQTTLMFHNDRGEVLNADVYRHSRPDVIKVYPDANLSCGFKTTLMDSESSSIHLTIRTSGGIHTSTIMIHGD